MLINQLKTVVDRFPMRLISRESIRLRPICQWNSAKLPSVIESSLALETAPQQQCSHESTMGSVWRRVKVTRSVFASSQNLRHVV
jgi:hypothetical protein